MEEEASVTHEISNVGILGERPIFKELENLPPYVPKLRQTLLFSATANQKQSFDDKKGKKIKGIGEGAVRALPRHLQE